MLTPNINNLIQWVEGSILRRQLLLRGERVLVAVSGGVDSMLLLRLLNSLSAEHGWQLTVAHANHGLRNRAAADASLVRRVARDLGLRFVMETLPVRETASKSGTSLEMAGRALRHQFLARTARRLGIGKIALAHHADDQVELFFLRTLRGSGSDGLSGMHWTSPSPVDKQITLIRPLLDVSREDILACARDFGVSFGEDETNLSTDFLRNRIRHELLPLLLSNYQPGLTRVILRTMELLRAEAEALEEQAACWLHRPYARFEDLPVALQRRVIHLQLIRTGESPDFDLIEGLRSGGGKAQMAPGGRRWVFCPANATLQAAAPDAEFKLDKLQISLSAAGAASFGHCQVRWMLRKSSGTALPAQKPNRHVFDADTVGKHATLRHWRPGDRFQPIGMQATVKLQDLFTNAKIPRAERRNLLVAETASGQLFWVENLRISEAHKVTSRTIRRLHWQWQRH